MLCTTNKRPRMLMEAMAYFSDPDVCDQYLASIKWPDGQPVCPKCGCANAVKIATRSAYQCRERGCRRQFRLKAGTIFEDSPLPLSKWFITAWMLATCRNGISSHEVARTIGVKQLSAWHMLHRLRLCVKPGGDRQLKGCVEVDETFVGGTLANMHASKRAKYPRDPKSNRINPYINRTLVQAFLERGGELRAYVTPGLSAQDLVPRIVDNVERHSFGYTDAANAYSTLSNEFVHRFVNHMYEYVRGNVHVNGVECYFSCLRRSLGGTYVSVEPKHLEAYCDEQAYRFTYRKDREWSRFDRLMHRVVGKRLMYSELTGGCKR